jgi:hypothetical protein
MRTIETMSLERFKALVEAYGASENAWPASERAAALAFCNANPQARALREEAASLDAILAQAQTVRPSAALEARIMNGFKHPAANVATMRTTWMGAGAIAACLVLSLMAGWAVLKTSHGQVDLSDPAAWDLIGEDLEFPTSKS